MNKLIAAALALTAAASVSGAASAQPMRHDHMRMDGHHRHQVRECSMRHHHRVCRMVWR